MDSLLSTFEQIKAEGEAYINRVVSERHQEGLNMEFKMARTTRPPMHVDDRKTLAEVISGFANATGGICIWGIEAKRINPEDPDEAQSLQPIPNIRRWGSDLNDFTPQVVSPVVEGVQHFIIPKSDSDDEGYAVTYVPESSGLPIMAIAKRNEQSCYFTRSGASFIRMESFMVADRYQRRPQPKLELVVESKLKRLIGGEGFNIELQLFLQNNGRGIAIYPAFECERMSTFGYSPAVGHNTYGTGLIYEIATSPSVKSHFFYGTTQHTVHPTRKLFIASLTGDTNSTAWLRSHSIEIKYKIYCDGFYHEGVWSKPKEYIVMDS